MQKALRSAVSAIMGRNMSHNIGSHVLARYSNAVGRVGEQRTNPNGGGAPEDSALARGVEDHRAVFLRYLQRRMDFTAEVSTSEKSFWSQSLSLCVVLSALNLEDEKIRINKQEDSEERELEFEPILLSFITGKEGIKASVDIGGMKRNDPFFSCPGGEIGAHALYVILENIIRNSARHNTNIDGNLVSLRVEVEDAEQDPNLWKVTIIDCQSTADVSKNVRKINRIINEEPILNHDGSPNQKFWGIREIQICAHYLRNFNMSDLEGTSYDPPVLKACEYYDAATTTSCLSYVIYLQRAKLCALICRQDTLDEKINNADPLLNKKLESAGIQLFSSVDNAKQLQGYSFVIVQQGLAEVNTTTMELEFGKNNDEIKKIPMLHLPVRTILVTEAFMKDRLGELGQCDLNPEKWLERIHEKMWQRYRDKRNNWKGKDVIAIVGWEKTASSNNGIFIHCEKGSWSQTVSRYANNGNLVLLWGDHANNVDFAQDRIPNLLSAACNTGFYYRENIVFAEILESLSPHKSLLEKQFSKKASGNELVAAAFARVIVLDERVQNEICRKYRVVDYKKLWPCMGVWVPMPNAVDGSETSSLPATDLNRPDFDSIKKFLQTPASLSTQFPPDFIVLHLTILESLKKGPGGQESEAATLAALLQETQVNEKCEIIIVTGRA